MRNKTPEQHKLNMQLAMCTVEILRAVAKDPFSTPTKKRLATWHANRKEGITSTEPTKKQKRARVLGQISFCLGGTRGQLYSVLRQFHNVLGQTDMTLVQEAAMSVALRAAEIHIDKVLAVAAQINKENKT
jgi:hypothetical protein